MSKYTLILFLSFLILIPGVKAEESSITTIDLMQTEFTPYSNISSYEGCVDCGIYLKNKYLYNDFNKFYSNSKNKTIFDNLWIKFYPRIFDMNDHHISVLIFSKSSSELDLFGIIITDFVADRYTAIMYFDGTYYDPIFASLGQSRPLYTINGSKFNPWEAMPHYSSANPFVVGIGDFSSTWFYLPTISFTNSLKSYNNAENIIFNIYDSQSNLIKTISYGDELPEIYIWNSFDPTSNYIDVNLNNYDYVILSLKDYNQTDVFDTNLKVKGMIGITPVYEYGTVEKIEITDRCNLSYSDFTDYRLYILKKDIQNKAVYYVKSCEQDSSFKFDSTIFDITYVTEENRDDPIITIGGQEYHTIPFNNLSNSANKNEENNFIPGESSNLVNSFGDIMSKPFEFFKDIVSAIGSFFSLINSFISFLPPTLQSFLYFSFVVAIVLGIIKIIL